MSKFEKPSVMTFADYEVILPANPLLGAASHVADNDPDNDPVARAEQALAVLASEFSNWMEAECERLDRERARLRHIGINDATHHALFRAAHDIKGEAATFGYPEVAGTAASLCRLLEHTSDMTRIPLALIDQHVDTVRAIIREHARSDAGELAKVLNSRLREVTEDFLRQDNRHRPDYLDSIASPR